MSSEAEPVDPFAGIDEMSEELRRKESRERAVADLRSYLGEIGHKLLEAGEKVAPPEWLCEGFFTLRSSALLIGKPKDGKSALALDIALGAATGTGAVRTPEGGWLFDFKGKRHRTFYLDTENNRSLLLRRLKSLCSEKGEEWDALLGSGDLICDPLELMRPPPFVSRQEGKPDLQADIEAARDFGRRMRAAEVSLIILDVMSHCYQEDSQGRDELAQGFIRDFFRIINAIVAESGACVLLVHHQRKGEGEGAEQASGSGQMLRTPELLLTLSRRKGEEKLFTLEKQGRQIRDPGKVHLEAGSTKDEACRIFAQVPEPEKKSRGRPAGERLEKAREVLGLIEERFARSVLEKPFTPAEWNKMAASVSEGDRKTLQGYRDALLKSGELEEAGSGLYKLREAGADSDQDELQRVREG